MTTPVPQPPRPLRSLLIRLAGSTSRRSAAGDLSEEYAERAALRGLSAARFWYFRQVILLIFFFLFESLYWRSLMLRHELKTALRIIRRHKGHSTLNIMGLAVGLACCILIYLFVAHEFSFDDFHSQGDRIYAVAGNSHPNLPPSTVGPPMGMAPAMAESFPEIERCVRLFSWGTAASVRYRDRIFRERPVFADHDFFEVFSFPFLQGDPRTALTGGDGVLLTHRTAVKYFGDDDPIGKPLTFQFGGVQEEFRVTGLVEDVPANSSVLFDIVLPIERIALINGPDYLLNFRWFNTRTFLLLREGASPEPLSGRLTDFFERHAPAASDADGGGDSRERSPVFRLQPLRSIHLDTEVVGNPRVSDIRRSYLLGGVALLILFTAAINFVNLWIGRASVRAVEVGVRKVLGADRKQLIRQFWCEATLTALAAVGVGLILAQLLLPLFNRLAVKQLHLAALLNGRALLVLAALVILVGVGAGSFPALVMTRVREVEIFKGHLRVGGRGRFSRVLVVFQFALAVFLVVATLVMSKQIRFLLHEPLGFYSSGVIVIQAQEREQGRSESVLRRFREHIREHPAVESVSAAFGSFGRNLAYAPWTVNGTTRFIHINKVDHAFIETLEIPLLAGRNFSPDRPSDATAALVNRSYIEELRLEAPLGEIVRFDGEHFPPLTIIGVVADYHYQTLREPIEPTVLMTAPDVSQPSLHHILVRTAPLEMSGLLRFLRDTWREMQPDKPFLYSFLEDDVAGTYAEPARWSTIVRASTALALFITCLGMIGLAAVAVSRRVKEIGVRKVLGAGVMRIVSLVAREFLPLIVTANLIGWPAAYFVMRGWLNGFAQRTGLEPGIFLLAGLLTLAVGVGTVGGLALKAARADPVDSLRYE